MEMQAKTIKGFTLLELLVVITIVSLISAAAYPNFNSWRSDRIVSKAATKLSVIFSTVFNYTQNGSYPFVQVYIDTTTAEIAGAKNGDEILVMGKGIPQDYFADALSRSNTSKLACSIDSTITWQEGISQKIRNDKIFFDFIDKGGICFSRNFSHYSINEENGELAKDGNYIQLCLRSTFHADGCKLGDINNTGPVYKVEWSRFGKVNLFKLIKGRNGEQEKDWVLR